MVVVALACTALLFCGDFGLGYGPVGVAYFKSGEAADGDVFSELAYLGGDHVLDATVWSLMKG